jgi:hypothetical protein
MHQIKSLFIGFILLAAQSAGIWHAYSHLDAQSIRHQHQHSDDSRELHSHEHSNASDDLNTVLCEMLDHLGGPAFIQDTPYVIAELANFFKLAHDFVDYAVPHTVHFLSTGPPVQTKLVSS